MSVKNIRVVLFFTRGVSLKTWADNGSLSREIALYVQLQEKGVKVSFITYGDKTDLQYREQLRGIEILCNRWNIPQPIYESLIPLLHARTLFRASIIKTNQTDGAEVGLRAARIWRKPFIARCGYMLTEWIELTGTLQSLKEARFLEKQTFQGACRVVVTTPAMRSYAIQQYSLSPEYVKVIPNYVMTDLFKPNKQPHIPNRVCFVGRLVEQKNLLALIHACEGLQVELYLIGEGHLRAALREAADQSDVHLVMPGNLPHYQLPEVICSSTLFILASIYEGHPKSLLEAMSCGAAVLGANSTGIREQIVHGETGWLVGTDVESIRAGIQHLLADTPLREKLGTNARRFILGNYSLDKIVDMEYSLLRDIMDHPQGY
jgi:glycosyltransferase involved in cell wall biosynthesis